MTDPISSAWKDQENDARFSDAGQCRRRIGSLEQRIRRRNMREFVVGGLIIVAGLAGLVLTLANERYAFAISALAIVVGTFVILQHLHAHGRSEDRIPETPCRDHLRGQLARQRDLLRSVPGWYLFPLVPGILAFYTATIMETTPRIGLTDAIVDILPQLSVTIIVFVVVAALNLRAARTLEEEIEQIDSLAT